MARIAIVDNNGLRKLTLREGLRLFGFPDNYFLPVTLEEGFDLLGNTIAVNVVEAVSERVAAMYKSQLSFKKQVHQTKFRPVAVL